MFAFLSVRILVHSSPVFALLLDNGLVFFLPPLIPVFPTIFRKDRPMSVESGFHRNSLPPLSVKTLADIELL